MNQLRSNPDIPQSVQDEAAGPMPLPPLRPSQLRDIARDAALYAIQNHRCLSHGCLWAVKQVIIPTPELLRDIEVLATSYIREHMPEMLEDHS